MIDESAINATIIAALANATASWTPAGGSATPVTGIFDRSYNQVQGGFVGFESTQPSFTALESDLPNAAQGDALTVNTKNFVVVGVQPDNGITRLVLREA
jgi:hypothetical protein